MPSLDWTPEHAVEEAPTAEAVQPATVLYALEVPRIFTTTDTVWQYLWYLCDANETTLRYIRVSTNDLTIENIQNGSMTVFEALCVPALYLIDLDDDFNVLTSWRTSIQFIPEDFLPKPHVMLYAHLEPLLHLKLSGPLLHAGIAPTSALKRGVDGAYLALKKLYEATNAGAAIGRPARAAKKLFDPPVQRMAFGSVEIAFANISTAQIAVEDDTPAKLSAMSGALEAGLSWIADELEAATEQPSLNILEAIEKLTPPLDGVIESVTVRGSIMPRHKQIVLFRDHSRKVKAAIKSARVIENEVISTLHGFIREFDMDRQSFTLRDNEGSDLGTFICDEDIYDDAYDAFLSGTNVSVVSRRRTGSTFFEANMIVPRTEGRPLLFE